VRCLKFETRFELEIQRRVFSCNRRQTVLVEYITVVLYLFSITNRLNRSRFSVDIYSFLLKLLVSGAFHV